MQCNTSPLSLFTDLLKAALQVRKRFFSFSDLCFELARIKSDFSAAAAGELTVRLYPSDAFLRFATTVFAGDLNFCAIQESSHISLRNT